MDRDVDPVQFLDLEPDERLLGADLSQLPDALGRPAQPVAGPSRDRIVAAGATLTGATLIGGGALAVFAVVDAIVAAGLGTAQIVMLVVGLILVATHWGWVHVAELTAQSLDARANRTVDERNRRWLAAIEPHAHWSVSTSVQEDGSITILTVRHRPVVRGERHFTFAREVVAQEAHSGDEPAAAVAARAEELRRRAAVATADAQARLRAARDAGELARLDAAGEAERIAAVRATSEALSDRINAHLRDPPLSE